MKNSVELQLDLDQLLIALADLFAEGDQEIALLADSKLRNHGKPEKEWWNSGFSLPSQLAGLLTQSIAHQCMTEIMSLWAKLPWYRAGYEDGRISRDVAAHMFTVELIGSNGVVKDSDCRIGLFIHEPSINYAVRTHAAEEMFIIIAGEAEWQQSENPHVKRDAGARIHHASYEPHASRTTNSAILAAWAWVGNINFETYRYDSH